MANTFIKPSVIAQTMIQLLFRELVLARTVWTDAVRSDDFVNALNDTVNLRVPARRTARTRTLRAGTPLTADVSNEFAVPVQLTTDVYNGAPITDEELSLDIVNFGEQVLVPQVRAVAEGIEDLIAAEITGASYGTVLDFDESDPWVTAVAARKILNDNNVPKANRFWVVGSGVESELLLSDRFVKADNIGAERASSTFEDAVIGRIAGFTVLQSNAIDEDESYAYVRSAFVAAGRTPKIPQGAAFGQVTPLSSAERVQVGASMGGLSARWVMDYDSVNGTDRSWTSSWFGSATVEDPDDPSDPESTTSFIRGLKITLSGS
jgi:hypothetical protein